MNNVVKYQTFEAKKPKTRDYQLNNFTKVREYGDSVFVTINLSTIGYSKDGLKKLNVMLSLLEAMGFKSINTTYNTGYYESVEDISLEFHELMATVDMDLLAGYQEGKELGF